MYAPDFAYYRADSVAEIGRLLRAHPGAKVLAGGHSLIPLLKLRLAAPPALIDIGRIGELKGISVADGRLRIGALTTHAQIAASADVAKHAPALAAAAGVIGDPAVRNRGTIGGNVAHADPASDLPTVLLALGASFAVATDDGERTIAAGDFFQGMMATALEDHDIVTAIDVPAAPDGQGQAYEKFSHPASRYAVIGVAATVELRGGTVGNVAVALGGLVPAAARGRVGRAGPVGPGGVGRGHRRRGGGGVERPRRRPHRRHLRVGRVPAGDGPGVRQAGADGGPQAGLGGRGPGGAQPVVEAVLAVGLVGRQAEPSGHALRARRSRRAARTSGGSVRRQGAPGCAFRARFRQPAATGVAPGLRRRPTRLPASPNRDTGTIQ